MSEELWREIRKLEVRLEDSSRENDEFVGELRRCLAKFKEVNNELERSKMSPDP